MVDMVETLHTTSRFYVNLGYLRPAFDYVRSKGEVLGPYLKPFGVQESDLVNADLRVPAEAMNKMFALAEERLGDANIGLHIAKTTQLQNLGILGLLIMNCRYAREVFDLHARYQTLVGNPVNTQYFTVDKRSYLETRPADGLVPFSRHSYDFIFGGWWHLKRTVVGQLPLPQAIELPYPAPADCSELEEFFGASLSFGHELLRIYFDSRYLSLQLIPADSQLKQLIEAQAKLRLRQLQGVQSDDDSELSEVKQFIAERLAFGAPSIEEIADDLGVSARTVQRQLENLGTSYRTLLEQVRVQLAGKYVVHEELSLLDVAMMLGFSEQSGFQRAFKRWFGCTPGEYRKLHCSA